MKDDKTKKEEAELQLKERIQKEIERTKLLLLELREKAKKNRKIILTASGLTVLILAMNYFYGPDIINFFLHPEEKAFAIQLGRILTGSREFFAIKMSADGVMIWTRHLNILNLNFSPEITQFLISLIQIIQLVLNKLPIHIILIQPN